jgi:hypothetical protein
MKRNALTAILDGAELNSIHLAVTPPDWPVSGLAE